MEFEVEQPVPSEGDVRSGGRGVLYSNLAVILFGLAGVLGKLSGLPSPLIVLGRVVFASLALGVVVVVRGSVSGPRHVRDVALLAWPGLLLAIHWIAFFQSINVSSVAIGLLSYSSFPLFTAIAEPALFRQRASRAQIAGGFAILVGVYLLVPSFTLDNRVTVGILWGLLAGATFAILAVTNRWLGRKFASVTISLTQDSVAAVALLPTLFLIQSSAPLSWRQFVILAGLGIVCTALAHTLFIEGMRHISAQLASLSASLEPIWGIGFALILLGEVPSGRTLVGGGLILAATTLSTFFSLRQRTTIQHTNQPIVR